MQVELEPEVEKQAREYIAARQRIQPEYNTSLTKLINFHARVSISTAMDEVEEKFGKSIKTS
jgi:hypothetical protein